MKQIAVKGIENLAWNTKIQKIGLKNSLSKLNRAYKKKSWNGGYLQKAREHKEMSAYILYLLKKGYRWTEHLFTATLINKANIQPKGTGKRGTVYDYFLLFTSNLICSSFMLPITSRQKRQKKNLQSWFISIHSPSA